MDDSCFSNIHDCADVCNGDAFIQTYWYDSDGDDLGGEINDDFCIADILFGWVLNSDDEDDDCYSNYHDCAGICNGFSQIIAYCEDTDNDSLLNIESRSLNCIDASIPGNCEPNFDSCLFMNCDNHPMYTGTVINCQGKLPGSDDCNEASATCINFGDYLEDGTCDFLDTNCEEFNFDEGDCEVIPGECPAGQIFDCNGNCAPEGWLGDGFCDDGSYNFGGNDIFFNCDEFNNDAGDCDSLGRATQQRVYPNGRIRTN